MNRTGTAALTLALALLAAFAAPAAMADGRARGHGRDHGDERVFDDRRISLDEAMAQAERRYRARAVHGEVQRRGDRIVYRIRLLGDDGRVFEVTVDAESGREH